MEQKSNVQYRAEKEYKNSREKFSLLLREIISNSIHAVLIRQSKETDFSPKVSLNSCKYRSYKGEVGKTAPRTGSSGTSTQRPPTGNGLPT